MERKTSLTTSMRMSEINLTPLMDLTFILLITFIITFPLLEKGVEINLPETGGTDLSPEESVTVTLDAKGGLFLDNASISYEGFEQEMQILSSDWPNTVVMVRADKSLTYGEVMGVLRVLHNSGITKMSLVTEGDGGEDK